MDREKIITQLKEEGFEGFYSLSELKGKIGRVPDQYGGVYIILYVSDDFPKFVLEQKYIGQLTKNINSLELNWIEDEPILYIGCSDNLQIRLKDLINFGIGKGDRHQGGKCIWHLGNCWDLVICWKKLKLSQSPDEYKSILLNEFKISHYGKLPFANVYDLSNGNNINKIFDELGIKI